MSNSSYHSNYRQSRPQWGSDTAVKGKRNTRQVLLNELNNYRRITHNGFNFYLTIIDKKHPMFIRQTDRGFDRWRMRFNVFASGFFAEWHPNTVLHFGELQVFYDLMPNRPKPWLLDFTFYYDDRDIGSQVMSDRYKLMDEAFIDSLLGRDQVLKYLLYLPIDRKQFVAPDEYLDKFIECQNEMVSCHQSIKQNDEFRQNNGSGESNAGNKKENYEKKKPLRTQTDGWRHPNNRRKKTTDRYQSTLDY